VGGGETATAAVRNAMRTAAAQSPAWTKGVEGGAVEERARHFGVDEGDEVKKGNDGGRCLLWRPGGAGGEEKGQGSGSGGATRRHSTMGPDRQWEREARGPTREKKRSGPNPDEL
jgi:hypothetical protein